MVDALGTPAVMARFTSPSESLGSIDPGTVAALVGAVADVTLILDPNGVVLDVAFGNVELAEDLSRDWIGRRWMETVSSESRPKVEALLREAATGTASRWRQVNHPGLKGPDVPVRYSVIRYGPDQRLVAVGRDLRAMAALQQRVFEAQQTMEREYERIRSSEKRYRLLFQLAAEAVIIVNASSQRVTEANPAALAVTGRDARKVVGAGFANLFDEASQQAVHSFMSALRLAPRVDNVHAKLEASDESFLLSGALFRQDNEAYLLVLMSRLGGGTMQPQSDRSHLLRVVEKMPDALVVTDHERRILTANAAFVDLVQAASEEQVRGASLERWLGRPGVDSDVLFATLRSHGSVRHFSTILRGEFGTSEDVEVTGIEVPSGEKPCFGFSIRTAGLRAGRERLGGRELPRTAEQFTDLVGRVPLKDLVRETTDLIERLCIEAALQLTGDNRASAAEMLGLSRQGLYVKLRRYGLGDLDGDETAEPRA